MPTDVRLTKRERNDVLSFVEKAGLNASDFRWSDEEAPEHRSGFPVYFIVSVLTHLPTGYYCKFGDTRVEYSPGPDRRVGTDEDGHDWTTKGYSSQLWLEELRKEVDAPDLWATIGQERAIPTAAASASVDNRRFTPDEQRLIAAKLDEIKGYLIEGQQFDVDQADAVDHKFAYLKESANRLGRKDWLNILYGGLVGLAITLALDPEKARGLLRLAGAAFQALWGGVQGYMR